MLVDKFNRQIDYLRIGVTDRCNLRCRYCMPEHGIDFADRKDILSFEEIIRLGKVFSSLGVNKVRFTGGEPFVRKDIEKLLRELNKLFPALHITTNATLLHNYIPFLKEISIGGLNISIDSLDKDKFHLITRRDSYDIVMDNILACLDNHIPIKLNVVVMKGINDNEINDFIDFGIKHKVDVRFIEAMPFNEHDGNKSLFIPYDEIFKIIQSKYPDAQLVENKKGSSSLKYTANGSQTFGIIPAYSRLLCGSCNRIRLTPKGDMITCLYSNTGINLLKLVRNSTLTDQDLKTYISNHIITKKENGFIEESLRSETIFSSMTTIGG